MGTAIGVGFWVQGDEVLELHARGELIRVVFLAVYGVRRRALLAEGASEAEADEHAMDEAEAITRATFPGWDFDVWSEKQGFAGKADRPRDGSVPFEEARPCSARAEAPAARRAARGEQG